MINIIIGCFIGCLAENILLGVVQYLLTQRAKRRVSESGLPRGNNLRKNYSKKGSL